MIDKEFIKRCNGMFEEQAIRHNKEQREIQRIRIKNWNNNNRKFLRECIKKYFNTEKGKYAYSIAQYNRRSRFKQASKDIPWKERILIGKFYKNCPEGYEVDHIIPIARGGKHRLSNLQYLTEKENQSKGARLDWKT